MQNYKQISYDPQPSVIGVDNGIYQLEFKEKSLKKNSNYKEIEQRLFSFNIEEQAKTVELPIEHLEGTLLTKAKLTDLIVFTPHFNGYKYLISQKVANYLGNAVDETEYHLREVKINGSKGNYYLLFIPTIPCTEVDFPMSRIFPEKDYLNDEKKYFGINSYVEYQDLLNTNPLVSFEKICLPVKYCKLNILSVQGAADLFFSEELITILQKAEVTNFRVPKRQIQLVFSL